MHLQGIQLGAVLSSVSSLRLLSFSRSCSLSGWDCEKWQRCFFVKKQKEMNEQQILVRSATVLSEAARKRLQEVCLTSLSLIDLTHWNWYQLPALRHKSLYDAIALLHSWKKNTKSSMDATEADKPSSRRSACLHQILSVMARYRFGNAYDFYICRLNTNPACSLCASTIAFRSRSCRCSPSKSFKTWSFSNNEASKVLQRFGGKKNIRHLKLIEFGLNCLDPRPSVPISHWFRSIPTLSISWLIVFHHLDWHQKIPTSGYRYLKAAKTEPHWPVNSKPSNDADFTPPTRLPQLAPLASSSRGQLAPWVAPCVPLRHLSLNPQVGRFHPSKNRCQLRLVTWITLSIWPRAACP